MMEHENKQRIWAVLGAIAAVSSWGVTFVATKVALNYISPSAVVWLRFGVGVCLLGAAVTIRKPTAKFVTKDFLYFALLGFIGITLHQLLQSTGLQTSQASTTAWIVATTPIFMALLGWLLLREKMQIYQVVGIIVAAFGVLLVVTKGNFQNMIQGQFGAPGDLLIMLSAPNWAIFSTLSRRGLQRFPAILMIFYVMLFGWLFSTLVFFSQSGFKQFLVLAWDGWLAILFLGVFGSGFAYIFWYDALKILPVASVGAFLYLEPFVTVVVAALILKEPMSVTSLIGGGGILFGVWIVNNTRFNKRSRI